MKRERAVTLKDGTRGIVRPIVPNDRGNLQEAFEDLAEESREQRFFYGKSSISPKELERLSTPDGKDHIAFGLEVRTGEGDEMMPIAVARCFRDPKDSQLAEIAIVTADPWQGLGAGAELVRSLSAAASDVGIRRWFALMFADNHSMRRLLARYGRKLEEREIGAGTVEVIYEIVEPPGGFFGS
jgi:acetyltransferase